MCYHKFQETNDFSGTTYRFFMVDTAELQASYSRKLGDK